MKNLIVRSAVVAGSVLASVNAMALDYTGAATAATTEVNAAFTAALPIGALVLGAFVGWGIFRRMSRG